MALEEAMAWEAVEEAWKTRRTAWAGEAARASTLPAAARVLLELEGNTRWSAVRATWKTGRDGWVQRVTSLTSPAAAAPAPAPPGSAPGSASPEMQAFLAGFNGDYKAVKAALAKYGAPGLDDQDMGVMNLAAARVTASAMKAGQQCYTFEAEAGIMVRTYGVCWAGGKIVAVEDKGAR